MFKHEVLNLHLNQLCSASAHHLHYFPYIDTPRDRIELVQASSVFLYFERV